jgi:hypothetical protein
MAAQPPGAPDYFALFQSMFTPVAAQPAAAANPFAMLDPKELEKKIVELETVLAWLKATTGMIEISIETMKYQRTLLQSLSGEPSPPPPSASTPSMQDLGKMAEAMNPALWALNMMQQPISPTAAKAPKKPAAATSRQTPKKTRRKSSTQ